LDDGLTLESGAKNMEWTKDSYRISTEKSRLDLEVIYGFLQTSYWGSSRSREQITKTMETSVCFGVFQGTRQIGFGRVVTDEVVVSWLGDVFIIPEFQKRGLGKWLMECIVSHPTIRKTKCLLGTRDAHGLYAKYGFKRQELMSRAEDTVD
jgi:GNAT superfamily N-acetyltransferase